jgi:hypothetical protein
METDTTIDFIAVGVVALVVGYIVYEISQAASDVSDSIGSYGVGAGLGVLGTIGAALLLF